jgi:hypothetical protein
MGCPPGVTQAIGKLGQSAIAAEQFPAIKATPNNDVRVFMVMPLEEDACKKERRAN